MVLEFFKQESEVDVILIKVKGKGRRSVSFGRVESDRDFGSGGNGSDFRRWRTA